MSPTVHRPSPPHTRGRKPHCLCCCLDPSDQPLLKLRAVSLLMRETGLFCAACVCSVRGGRGSGPPLIVSFLNHETDSDALNLNFRSGTVSRIRQSTSDCCRVGSCVAVAHCRFSPVGFAENYAAPASTRSRLGIGSRHSAIGNVRHAAIRKKAEKEQ